MLKVERLGVSSLTLLCINSMLGAGFFALPQNVATTAGLKALLIAWAITFTGMFALVRVFQNLTVRRADLDTGIYSYAQAALGDYVGFNAAWGYWLSILIGNIGYLIMCCAACAVFFPDFGNGTTLTSLLVGSCLIWLTTAICWRGVKTAALVNNMVTLLKIIPILGFIGVIFYAFRMNNFVASFNCVEPLLGSTLQQVLATMMTTVWVFVGVEGASILSQRAKSRREVSLATGMSFFVMLLLLFSVSVVPYGIFSRPALASLAEPSTGAILQHLVGISGQRLMNAALIVTVLGSLLSWVLLSAEVPFVAARRSGLFPTVFTRENHWQAPSGALLIGAICEQLYFLLVYFFKLGYLKTIIIAGTMIIPPYCLAAVYAVKLALTGETYSGQPARIRWLEGGCGVIALLYSGWLVFAAGKDLIWASLLYTVGISVYWWQRRKNSKKIWNFWEKLILWGLVVCAGGTLYYWWY